MKAFDENSMIISEHVNFNELHLVTLPFQMKLATP